jgi:hypothetical protein
VRVAKYFTQKTGETGFGPYLVGLSAHSFRGLHKAWLSPLVSLVIPEALTAQHLDSVPAYRCRHIGTNRNRDVTNESGTETGGGMGDEGVPDGDSTQLKRVD